MLVIILFSVIKHFQVTLIYLSRGNCNNLIISDGFYIICEPSIFYCKLINQHLLKHWLNNGLEWKIILLQTK